MSPPPHRLTQTPLHPHIFLPRKDCMLTLAPCSRAETDRTIFFAQHFSKIPMQQTQNHVVVEVLLWFYFCFAHSVIILKCLSLLFYIKEGKPAFALHLALPDVFSLRFHVHKHACSAFHAGACLSNVFRADQSTCASWLHMLCGGVPHSARGHRANNHMSFVVACLEARVRSNKFPSWIGF